MAVLPVLLSVLSVLVREGGLLVAGFPYLESPSRRWESADGGVPAPLANGLGKAPLPGVLFPRFSLLVF